MKKFIGRRAELNQLTSLYTTGDSNIVVVTGRRRIGKSHLIREFAKNTTFFEFSGLSPSEGITDQMQRDHFGRQLSSHLKQPPMTFNDWSDAFEHLAINVDETGTVILLDEISWMGAKDATFIPKLKSWWDTSLSRKRNICLVFCGSVSTWIEYNILNSTAFFGRISLTIQLEPFTIPESVLFLKTMGYKGSNYDIYKLLSVLGGIPWYLEHVKIDSMAENNIKELCFLKNGLLVNEFDKIFNDLFNLRSKNYKLILDVLKDGMKTQSEIRNLINYQHSGTLGILLEHLITANFIEKNYSWSIKTAKTSKQSLYRICDPYMRYYLKNIEPNLSKINKKYYSDVDIANIPGFDSNIGLQVEQILLQNRKILLGAIGVNPTECTFDGPYRQNSTSKIKGCQIDYLIQTRTKTIFICEFKFRNREVGTEMIEEMENKISKLLVPSGFATVPVLFHIGGVSSALSESNYFYRIIDITDFCEPTIK